MTAALAAWHVPAAFDLALRSPGWHKLEHACFLGAALLFWWPVVQPFPSRPRWPRWALPLYLLAADVVNTVLCGFLTFSERVIYSVYETAPRLFGTTALSDQAAAGVIMWVPGSLIFLTPAVVIMVRYLSPAQGLVRPMASRRGRASLPPEEQPRPRAAQPFDLLTVPVFGRFLRSNTGRRTLQTTLLVLAVAVIVDGLRGPQVSASNLAGQVPWIYWRGLTVIALLVAGNFFCMACPFTLPRELARRIRSATRTWPRALRSKWLAFALLLLFFWAYEVFDLWDRPAATASLLIAYFAAALGIDAIFRGASFCKYVCPIGQFQFVTSLVSPLEVKVRAPDICASCQTHDCLRGNDEQRGCEMELHLPRKASNLDCTFCLDCVRACPRDNIGLRAVTPAAELLHDARRSSVGRLSQRRDLATLALMLVFAALATAAAMTAPALAWRDRLAAQLGLASTWPIITAFFVATLVIAPWLVLRKKNPATDALRCRLAFALVPLGAALWAGHFLYHLLTAGPTGLTMNALLILQTLLLDAGFLGTLYLLWRGAAESRSRPRAFAPWAVLAVALYAGGVWVFVQPMAMRGMAMSIPMP
jgi:hypothetical protein